MKNMSVKEFCDLHAACNESRAWALANCASMEDAWTKLKPEWLIWVATRPGVLTDRELRLFAVWCARKVQHLMKDARSIAALDVAERHANGLATDEELATARDAALCAAWNDSQDAAWIALDAAWVAARNAALNAARDAAWNDSQDAQAKWLRDNTRPNFTK